MNGMSYWTQYPQAEALEARLSRWATALGDRTDKPFRVDIVRVHGGKPPIYSVVIRSVAKEPLRQKLEQMLHRRLTCGISSFMLKADEAKFIVEETLRDSDHPDNLGEGAHKDREG
jgi:hypothetical protein